MLMRSPALPYRTVALVEKTAKLCPLEGCSELSVTWSFVAIVRGWICPGCSKTLEQEGGVVQTGPVGVTSIQSAGYEIKKSRGVVPALRSCTDRKSTRLNSSH